MRAGASVKVDFEDAVAGEPPLSPLAVEVVSRMKGAISALTEADPESSSQRDGARMTPPASEAKKSSGFFLPDAFTNPDHVRYALKTTAAAMFCYVSYSLLDWPGIHTSFLTCYIVSLQTTAETIEKLTLRISGCLIGTAAGYARHRVPHSLPYLDRRSLSRGVRWERSRRRGSRPEVRESHTPDSRSPSLSFYAPFKARALHSI